MISTSARVRPASASSSSRRASGAARSSGRRLKVCHPWAARATRRRAGSLSPPTWMGGWGAWTGLGNMLHERQAVEVAVEARGVVAPQGPQHLEVLVGAGPPAVPGDVHRLELLGQPPDAHPEVDPAARQPVHGRDLLGHVDRVALGEEQHRRPQSDPVGLGGEEGEGGQGLEQARPRRGRDAAVLGVGVGGGVVVEEHDVLADPQAVDPPLVALGAERGEELGGGERVGRRHPQVEVHGVGSVRTRRTAPRRPGRTG